MSVFVPNTGDPQLNLVLEELANNVVTGAVSAAAGDSVYVAGDNSIRTPSGAIVGYVNQYIWVTFADDVYGTGASSSPLNKSYYGLLNTADGSNTPSNFLSFSYTATTGFGLNNELYYRTTGGRTIDWTVAAVSPGNSWLQANPGNLYVPIDLDILTEAGTPGANGFSTATETIFRADNTTPVAPTGGSYTFTGTPSQVIPTGWSNTIPVTANTNVWAAQYTFVSNVPNATVTAGTWTAPVVVYRVARDGADAQSVYQFPVYTDSATQPNAPVANTGYWNFGTGTGGAPTGDPGTVIWTLQPTVSSNLWVSYSTAAANSGGNANALMWSTPVPLAQTGAAGQNGLSIYNYPVYFSSETAPATPTGGSYDFGTRVGTPPTGWTNTPGANTVWVSTAAAQIQGTTGVWTGGANSWSTPTQFTGQTGRSTVIPLVFQANSAAPPTISTSGYYNFATNTLTPPTGWVANLPVNSGLPIWSSQASFISTDPTANIPNTTSWTSPAIAFQSGGAGPAGSRGFIPMAFVLVATDPTSYSNADFTAAFSASRSNINPPVGTGYTPIAGDTAGFYWNNPVAGGDDVRVVKTYDGTGWLTAVGQVIDGNLLVSGTVSAAQMNTNSLYALNIQSTNANFANFQGNGYWMEAASGNAYFAGGVRIGNGLVIGDNVTIGNNLIVGNGAVLGNNAIIGNNLGIGNNLIVGNNAVVGANLTVGSDAVIGANLSVAGLVTGGALNSNVVFTNNIVEQGVTNSVTVADSPDVNQVGFVSSINWPNNTRGIGISGGATITPSSSNSRIEIVFTSYVYSQANSSANATTQANQANSSIIEIWRSGASTYYPNNIVGLESTYAVDPVTTISLIHAIVVPSTGNSFVLSSNNSGSSWQTGLATFGSYRPFNTRIVTKYKNYPYVTSLDDRSATAYTLSAGCTDGRIWQSSYGYATRSGTANIYAAITTGNDPTSAYASDAFMGVGAGGTIYRFWPAWGYRTNYISGNPINDLYSVDYNRAVADYSAQNTTIVAICGSGGLIASGYLARPIGGTSPVSETYLNRVTNTTENLNRIRCNWVQNLSNTNPAGSLWVCVGNNGTLLTSPDAVNWTIRDTGVNENLHGITYSGSVWLVVGERGRVLTSTDGETWTASTVDTGTDPLLNLYTATFNWDADAWFIGGQGEFVARSTANSTPSWTTVRAAQPAATFSLTRLWYAGSDANVFQTGTPAEQARITNGTVISATISDTGLQAGVPVTYYVVIGNNSGDANVVVYTTGPTMTVTEIKR